MSGWRRFALSAIALALTVYGLVALVAGFVNNMFFLHAVIILPPGLLMFVWLRKRFGAEP